MATNLKLTRNLGIADAERYGLKLEEAKEGNEVSVTNDARDSLIARKLAVDLKAVPQSNVETVKADEKPDFDSMTLEELRGYAKENNIEGASSLNKDDTLKLVKKNFNKVR